MKSIRTLSPLVMVLALWIEICLLDLIYTHGPGVDSIRVMKGPCVSEEN